MIDHHVDICAQLKNITISCSDTQFCIYMQVVFPWILLLTGSQPHDVQKSSHHRMSQRNEVTRPPSIYEKQHNWINQNWQVHTILVTHKWSNLDIRNAKTKGVLFFLYVNKVRKCILFDLQALWDSSKPHIHPVSYSMYDSKYARICTFFPQKNVVQLIHNLAMSY